jgi:hypothetical protein
LERKHADGKDYIPMKKGMVSGLRTILVPSKRVYFFKRYFRLVFAKNRNF